MSTKRPFAFSRRCVLAAASLPLMPPAAVLAGEKPAAPSAPPLYGKLRAAKRFVVWGSYTCPYTAELLPVLMKIVDGNPRRDSLEWHHFPTHPPDPALHVQGLAFTGKHFWGFTSAVLAAVYEAGGDFRTLSPEKLARFAQAEGGSPDSLHAALADPARWKTVKDDFLAGKLLGVVTTPGLFYDGFFLTPGGLPSDLKGFETSLRAMIAKA